MDQVVYDVLILFNDGTQTVIRKAKNFEWVAGAEFAFITTETGYRMYFNTRNIKMMAREYDCLEYMVNPRAEIERKPEPECKSICGATGLPCIFCHPVCGSRREVQHEAD